MTGLLCSPCPHVRLHGDHPSSWNSQATGHACTLQLCWPCVVEHGVPPCRGAASTVRLRVCRPDPQGCVHSDHSDHGARTQCTGHGCSEHAFASESAPHARPPCDGRTSTLRWRVDVPPPQVFVHVSHAPHADIAQSTAQSWPLHTRLSTSAAHGAPPCAGGVRTCRECDWAPPPHVCVHSPHALQADSSQGTGQACAPQCRLCESVGQRLPPALACRTTSRLRDWDPVPHVFVHAVQAVNDETSQ